MMKHTSLFFLILVFSIGCREKKEIRQVTAQLGCAPMTTDKEWYGSGKIAPLFEGLGKLYFPISTQNELVQRYFDQGLVLAYGFNHAEAARSFYHATKLDPNCAMAYWGFAYVLGPNYNAGMESDNYERAYGAIQKAIVLSGGDLTEKEKDLILALSKRYVKKAVEDRYPLDVAYSNEMEALSKKYPEDADIGTLYAESIMNLHPWDLYEKDGRPKGWTEPILNTLKQILAKHPEHCGANHFYIHAVESSKTPEKGLTSAEIFDRDLVPNAGHLVHMPSHIYIRTGDYHKGTLSNIRAIAVDSAYVNACNAQGAYPLAYFPHNQHFMAATATLEGNSKWALYAADEVAKNANTQLMKAPEWGTLQHYYTIPFYVYVKFGKWDEILEMSNKVPELDYPQAMLHYARGMAFLGKGQIDDAKAELNSLAILAQNETLKEVTIWNINSVYDLVQIAEKILRATLLAKEKDFTQSISVLKEAIAIEDNLNYNEPPDWFFSVRHYLGAVQLDAGQNKEAVNTYLEDLENLPKNGWALHGLTTAYSNLNDFEDRKAAEEKFKAAWATADVELTGSKIK
jgi:tetratricopeptide (TPR) repeat protein